MLGTLLSLAAGPVLARAPERSLRPVLRPAGLGKRKGPSGADLVAQARVSGISGFAVADLKSGKFLETHNAVAALPPASVAKAITALYALDTLGASFRFHTRLVVTGPVEGGTLKGDLILVGGGDPTLDTNALADLARILKQAGVHRVDGDFRVSGSALPNLRQIDPEQPEHVSYNPAISGLNLNFNRVHFEWRRAGSGYSVTMDARSQKYRPDVRVARMQVIDRTLPTYTYRDGKTFDAWTVARRALGKGGARWLPVRKPELYAAEVFQTFARSHGIVLKPARIHTGQISGTEVARVSSAPLSTILRGMLKYSTNLTAEAVGMTASLTRRNAIPTLRASAREMNTWAQQNLGLRSPRMVDHSGLGDASRLTAQDTVTALVNANDRLAFAELLKEIPMRDANRKVIKSHPAKIRAKTGTLNFVSGLAGYVTAADGRRLAFAVFSADTRTRAGIKKADRERPKGARSWNTRAKKLQQALITRWTEIYKSS